MAAQQMRRGRMVLGVKAQTAALASGCKGLTVWVAKRTCLAR